MLGRWPLADVPTERLEAQITELAGHLAAAECRWLGLVGEFDRRKGIELLHKASDMGDGFAAHQLGLVHKFGYDVPVD